MARHIAIGKPVNAAESWAFEYLAGKLPESYTVLTNLEILAQSGQPLEVDALVFGRFAIYLLDVKGYLGTLNVDVNGWELNGAWVENSLAKANHVGRVLASRIRSRLPDGVHAPWCQGVVLVTGKEGLHVEVQKTEPELCVFTPDEIAQALTDEGYVTSRFRHPITEQQRDFALEVVGKIGVMAGRHNHIQDFVKRKQLGSLNGIEVWEATYQLGEWSDDWLLKVVSTNSVNDPESFVEASTRLKQEFFRLQQLAGVSGVPVVAPVINDGEQIVLPVKRPRGVPLGALDLASFDAGQVTRILRRAVVSLQQIHQRGCTLGALGENSVFVSSEGDLEFLDVRNNLEQEADIEHFRTLFRELASRAGEKLIYEWFAGDGGDRDLEWIRQQLNLALAGATPLADESDISIVEGETIAGRYLLKSRLFDVGPVEHWMATHLAGDFDCVVSVYSHAAELWQEASSQYSGLMQLYHPSIERIFDMDVIQPADVYYICRAWVPGSPLTTAAGEAGPEQVRGWFRALLTAIQYMHDAGLSHRNVSPESIICNSDTAVLVNFSGLPATVMATGDISVADPDVSETGWTREADIYALILSFARALGRNGSVSAPDVDTVEDVFAGFCSTETARAVAAFVAERPVLADAISYLEFFKLSESEAPLDDLPGVFAARWGISRGYMTFLVLDMLNDPRPRSRNQWVLNALRSRHISGNKTNRGSMSATVSRLKTAGIAEDHGKKVRLTREFLEDWERCCEETE